MVMMRAGPKDLMCKSLFYNMQYTLCYGMINPEMCEDIYVYFCVLKEILYQYEHADDLTEEYELCLLMRNYIADFVEENKDWFKSTVSYSGKEYNHLHIILWHNFVKIAFVDCPFQGDIEQFMSAQLDPKYG